MKRGLFINPLPAQCSIYESGVMIKDILWNSPHYALEYIETNATLYNVDMKKKYDFVIINWHPVTLPISTYKLSNFSGMLISIVLETLPDNCFIYAKEHWFDAHMVIDPTKEKKGNIYPFPRPLEIVKELPKLLRTDKIVLGSFGFINPRGEWLKCKRYSEVIENANKIKNCIVRLNFPVGTYTGTPLSVLEEYGKTLKRMASRSVEVQVTYNYMTKTELINWCAENTANVFPYYRDNIPGLSAVTDQAITANRPIIVTDSATFRHLHTYISYYPNQSYKELIQSTLPGIKKMREDWSPEKFRDKFRVLLVEQGIL